MKTEDVQNTLEKIKKSMELIPVQLVEISLLKLFNDLGAKMFVGAVDKGRFFDKDECKKIGDTIEFCLNTLNKFTKDYIDPIQEQLTKIIKDEKKS